MILCDRLPFSAGRSAGGFLLQKIHTFDHNM